MEQLVEEKVKSGLYNNASEVVRDAIRRAFCETREMDLEQDTPELAALIREGFAGPHSVHKRGDIQKILGRVRNRLGK